MSNPTLDDVRAAMGWLGLVERELKAKKPVNIFAIDRALEDIYRVRTLALTPTQIIPAHALATDPQTEQR